MSEWRQPQPLRRLPFRLMALLAVIAFAVMGSISAHAARGSSPSQIKLINPNQIAGGHEANAVPFQLAKPGSGKGLKLGYISLSEAVPFVHLVTVGIQQQAARAGASLVVCDAKSDAATALNCAKFFKTEGVQGYLNFQVDANASASICAAGPQVPVIAIDIHQAPCEKAFMGANNSYAGYLSGIAMGKFFKTNFKCKYGAYVSLEGPEAGVVNTERMGGYRRGFSQVCGKIHNLRIEAADRIDVARTTFADVLTALSNVHRIIVVSINDDGIEGALAAARTAGRVSDLWLSGQGADPSSWCDIEGNHHWVADSAYFPEKYGEIGIPYLIKLVKHQSVAKLLLVQHRLINTLNIRQVYHPNCK